MRGGTEIPSLYGSTISRTAGWCPWTVLHKSQMLITNIADSWKNNLRKDVVAFFALAKNIWSMQFIGREGQLATKPSIPCASTQVAQMSVAFQASPRYIKVLLSGQFWENTGESTFPCKLRNQMLPGIAVCPKELGAPCSTFASTCGSAGFVKDTYSTQWKPASHPSQWYLEIQYLLASQFCKGCCQPALKMKFKKSFFSPTPNKGFPTQHKGSSLLSFPWTSGRLKKKEIYRTHFTLAKFIFLLPKCLYRSLFH